MGEDTPPIRTDERFDEERVGTYLRTVLGGEVPDTPFEFEQFPGVAANLTYAGRCGDLELVIRRPPLAEELVDTLADLHLVIPEDVGPGDLGRPDGFVQRQVDEWLRRCDEPRRGKYRTWSG